MLGELLYGGAASEKSNPLHAVVQCTAAIRDCHSFADEVSTRGNGAYYVGGLIGVTDVNKFADRTSVLIESCSASADVSSGSYYVGGLIGFCENATPEGVAVRPAAASDEANAAADINAGISMYTTVRDCYATGNVTGGIPDPASGAGTNAGGLIGHCHAGNNLPNDAMLIENCFASGAVSIASPGGYNAGGLVGRASKNTMIHSSYAVGDVYAPGLHAGGLIGFAEGDVTEDDYNVPYNVDTLRRRVP